MRCHIDYAELIIPFFVGLFDCVNHKNKLNMVWKEKSSLSEPDRLLFLKGAENGISVSPQFPDLLVVLADGAV